MEKLKDRFLPKECSELQLRRIEMLRSITTDLALTFDKYVEDSREKSLALSKLEEFLMWANRAVANEEQ